MIRAPKPPTVGELRRWLDGLHPDASIQIVATDGMELPILNAEGNSGEGGDWLRLTVATDQEIVVSRRRVQR